MKYICFPEIVQAIVIQIDDFRRRVAGVFLARASDAQDAADRCATPDLRARIADLETTSLNHNTYYLLVIFRHGPGPGATFQNPAARPVLSAAGPARRTGAPCGKSRIVEACELLDAHL